MAPPGEEKVSTRGVAVSPGTYHLPSVGAGRRRERGRLDSPWNRRAGTFASL